MYNSILFYSYYRWCDY